MPYNPRSTEARRAPPFRRRPLAFSDVDRNLARLNGGLVPSRQARHSSMSTPGDQWLIAYLAVARMAAMSMLALVAATLVGMMMLAQQLGVSPFPAVAALLTIVCFNGIALSVQRRQEQEWANTSRAASPSRSRASVNTEPYGSLTFAAIPERVDVAILTVLPIELRAAQKVFRTADKFALRGNRRFYSTHVRSRQLDGAPISIVLTSSNEPHNVQAAKAVHDIIQQFNPAAIFLVGIAGGEKKRVRLGDVVIPQAVHFYDPERLTDAGTEPRHDRALVPTDMRANLHYYDPLSTGLDRDIQAFSRRMATQERPRLPANFRPKVISHNAVIASGAKLLVDGRFLPQLRSRHDQRLVACDQESWGFAKGSEGLWWAIFRGISDHGDPQKDDRWHYLAAACAASCLRNFLETEYIPPRRAA